MGRRKGSKNGVHTTSHPKYFWEKRKWQQKPFIDRFLDITLIILILTVIFGAVLLFIPHSQVTKGMSSHNGSSSSIINSSRSSSNKTKKSSSQDSPTQAYNSNDTAVDSSITNSNTSSNNSSTPNSDSVTKGYVSGEGTRFAYNIGRAGGLIDGDSQELEDQFYQNYSMDDTTVTYNGKTVEYNKINRPDGTYYYSVTPAN